MQQYSSLMRAAQGVVTKILDPILSHIILRLGSEATIVILM